MKQTKQMRQDDWYNLFVSHPPAVEQAKIALGRAESGLALSSYEVAAIEAYELLQQRKAA